jgi:hypothetical protein
MTTVRDKGLMAPAALMLATLTLAACTTSASTPSGQGAAGPTLFGLVSAPVPQPAPFVVQSRPQMSAEFPAVGVTPPARGDKILSTSERAALEADLKAAAGTPPTAAAGTAPVKKRKKPLPPD